MARAAPRPYLQSGDAGGEGGQSRGAQVPAQQGVEGRGQGGVGRLPVRLQILCQVLAGVLQLVLVQDDVKHLLMTDRQTVEMDPFRIRASGLQSARRRTGAGTVTHRGTLSQFVCRHQLDVQVFALRLPSGFDQPLKNLQDRRSDRRFGRSQVHLQDISLKTQRFSHHDHLLILAPPLFTFRRTLALTFTR